MPSRGSDGWGMDISEGLYSVSTVYYNVLGARKNNKAKEEWWGLNDC